ncbi:MAG: hypothetical protein V1495_08780 [Pseudomonadota bacterium]
MTKRTVAIVLFTLSTSLPALAVSEWDIEPPTRTETVDPASSRVIWGPTALPNVRKGVRATAFNLGLWDFGFQVNDQATIGLQGVPPFGILVAGTAFRFTTSINPKLHLGVYGQGGMVSYLFKSSNDSAYYYGGGPILTIGDHRAAINIAMLNYGGHTGRRSGYAVVPNVGVSVSMAKHMKFNVEMFSFNAPRSDRWGKAWAVLYGLRFFGSGGSFFGDVSFVIPVYRKTSKILEYAPLGIPLLAFGFSF